MNQTGQGLYKDAFNHQVLKVQMAQQALQPETIGPPPFTTEYGYAHGTNECVWPPPSLGGEAEADYVEQVVVYIHGVPYSAARGDLLKVAKVLTGKFNSSFGILYVTIPEPGNAYLYCTDYRRAADLADIFNEAEWPADLSSTSKGGSSSSSSSGSSSSKRKHSGQKSSSKSGSGSGGGGSSSTVYVTYAQHCHYMISSAFLQHLHDIRSRRGRDGGDKVRAEWEVTHPSGRKPPPKSGKK